MAFHTTVATLREFKGMFESLDKSGDGYITAQDLVDSTTLNEEEAKKMMNDGDFDGNRKIDFNEYMRLMCAEKEAVLEEILDACAKVDKDESGFISAGELRPALESIGVVFLDDSVLAEKIKEADTNNDGKLYYNEFIHLLLKQV